MLFDRAVNNTVLNANMAYRNVSNSIIYMFVFTYHSPNADIAGLGNQSIIGSASSCSTYECPLNINKIVLPANRTGYMLRATMPLVKSKQVTRAAVALYNKQYFYVGDTVYNESS